MYENGPVVSDVSPVRGRLGDSHDGDSLHGPVTVLLPPIPGRDGSAESGVREEGIG